MDKPNDCCFDSEAFEQAAADAAMEMETEINKSRFDQLVKDCRKDAELANLIAETRSGWLRFLVQTNAAVFGILVALGDRTPNPMPARLAFALGIVLLALSLLCFGIALYANLYYLKRGRRLYAEESKKAYLNHRRKSPHLAVPTKRAFEYVETGGYICFAASLLALCVYVLLQVLP